jgi:TorA maturation chaperone TorD
LYRLLAALFSYPTGDSSALTRQSLEAATVAGELIGEPISIAVDEVRGAVLSNDGEDPESTYQKVFTLSYNEDCPLYETAFSARHIFQQTQQQADIAGFYRAFGVDPHAERPDHLALELEFLYLVTLKEAWAREQDEPEHVAVCRDAQRTFLRDHLARWAAPVAGRIALAGRGTVYEAVAHLLLSFIRWEQRYLRLGTVEHFSDEPVLIADEPGEFSCPLVDGFTPIELKGLKATDGGIP